MSTRPNLRLLDGSDQQSFSDQHAGVYALIRYDRAGDILISRMDIRERESQLCQFATDSGAAGASEPRVEGYIFAVGDWIQAVGRPRSANGLRHTILRSHRQPGSARWDMIGLRLGNSTYDGGPFAYRIFCRKLADEKMVGKEMDGWADLFGARRFAAIERVEETIDDIGAILLLLEEAEENDSQTPWGTRMPTGIS